VIDDLLAAPDLRRGQARAAQVLPLPTALEDLVRRPEDHDPHGRKTPPHEDELQESAAS